MNGKTLFDKIWESHAVVTTPDTPTILYIDVHFTHEVTSAQAYSGLEQRGIKVRQPKKTFATVDHNIPTQDQHLPIKEELSRLQVKKLGENAAKHGVEFFGYNHHKNGIVHVIGPELGITLPGKTIVCGDSHTSTHGAFGCISFGIGTSEVEMVLGTQTLLQTQPKKMQISIEGERRKGVTAKDIILYIIAQIGVGGGTGYFVEFAGSTIRNLSMEERMTICNMSIEMGARGGLIAPDDKTFQYIKGRERAPKGDEFKRHLKYWKTLTTDPDATFDKQINIKAENIAPMITYGSNPGMGISIGENIPTLDKIKIEEIDSFKKSLAYFDFKAGEQLLGKKIDYVFLGSCTNGRIEDIRSFTHFIKGNKKHPDVIVWIVPGSKRVEEQAQKEGLVETLQEYGFQMRQPGCSACLAMNDDKVPEGKYCISTSNRNFEGRQGPGSRTMLASPLTAAAAAITGKITDPREFM